MAINSTVYTGRTYYGLVSWDDIRNTIKIIPWVQVVVSGFGTVNNVINVVVFYRQGILADSCTPKLVGLAVSDFCISICFFAKGAFTMLPRGFPWASDRYTRRTYIRIGFMVATLNPLFSRTSGWITVYVAIERAVSVTLPFWAKIHFTSKRSCFILVGIFIVNIGLSSPGFLIHKYRRYSPYPNSSATHIYQTINAFIPLDLYDNKELFNDTILQSVFMTTVFVCNTIIIVRVTTSKKFRTGMKKLSPASNTKNDANVSSDSRVTVTGSHKPGTEIVSADMEAGKGRRAVKSGADRFSLSSLKFKAILDVSRVTKDSTHRHHHPPTSKSEDNSKSKEITLIRMMIVLFVMYLICNAPAFVFISDSLINRRYNLVAGLIILLFLCLKEIFQSFNSAFNFLVYLTISSRFRKEFKQLFRSSNNDNNNVRC